MKKYNILTILFLTSLSYASAQLNFLVLGGASPESNPHTAGLFINRHLPAQEFVWNMTGVSPQYFGGFKVQIPFTSPSFFSEAGLIFTQKTSRYSIQYTYTERSANILHTMNETENMLLVPANIGVHLGKIDVTSGLMAIVSLGKETELTQLNGFKSDLKRIRMGWSTGIRLNLFQTALGIEYQGTFNRIGQGMYVNDQSLELMHVPGQFVATIQYKL